MSTFYLLPPRTVLGERLAGFLNGLLPGLDWTLAARADLTLALESALSDRRDVFIVYREDLPEGEHPAEALTSAYGAEVGDEVVEVRVAAALGELVARRWRISA